MRVKLRGGVVFGLALLLVVFGWSAYVRTAAPPGDALVIPVADYAPGTVRLDQGVWVARQPSGDFYVFLDRDPHRGQPLNWVESEALFIQAAWYGIDGTCQGGPCDPSPGQGLYRVEARLDGESLIVYPEQIISGGLDPEPTWMTELRSFFMRPPSPAAPAPARRP